VPLTSKSAVGVFVPTPTSPVPFGIRARLLLFAVEIVFVPVPVNARDALLAVSFSPVVPPKVPFPARERFPSVSITLLLEKKFTLPVVPSVRLCPLVVPIVPVDVNDNAILFAPEMEAVGVPPATLVKANLAEPVAVEPRSRSSVIFVGAKALLFLWK